MATKLFPIQTDMKNDQKTARKAVCPKNITTRYHPSVDVRFAVSSGVLSDSVAVRPTA